jgi:hypothetical protein
MKNLILLMALISSFTVTARSLHPLTFVLTAELNEAMNIDQNSYLSNMRIYGGKVQVHQLEKNISLTLNFAADCPAGMVCPMVLSQHVIKLAITRDATDNCGNRTFTASKDLRPVDGALEVLTVSDFTKNICPTFAPLPATGVTFETSVYNRINGGLVTTYSSFEANKLNGRVTPTTRLKEVLKALK